MSRALDIDAWLAEQGELPADWEALLRRVYAEHGALGPAELAIAVDLERMRLVAAAVDLVTADVRATTGEPLSFDVHHQDEGSIGLLYRGNTDHSGFGLHAVSPEALLVEVADRIQDLVMHARWMAWPLCPAHDLGLYAELRDLPVWVCRSRDHVVAPIGRFAEARA